MGDGFAELVERLLGLGLSGGWGWSSVSCVSGGRVDVELCCEVAAISRWVG